VFSATLQNLIVFTYAPKQFPVAIKVYCKCATAFITQCAKFCTNCQNMHASQFDFEGNTFWYSSWQWCKNSRNEVHIGKYFAGATHLCLGRINKCQRVLFWFLCFKSVLIKCLFWNQSSMTTVEFLLLNGAKVDIRDSNGQGPLHHATQLGHTGYFTDLFVIVYEIRMLVCWWWRFVTTTSFILSYNKIQNGDVLVLANPGPPGRNGS